MMLTTGSPMVRQVALNSADPLHGWCRKTIAWRQFRGGCSLCYFYLIRSPAVLLGDLRKPLLVDVSGIGVLAVGG